MPEHNKVVVDKSHADAPERTGGKSIFIGTPSSTRPSTD
jgi:hypothetical protein